MPELLPLFLNVTGRDVLLVGGGRVAAAKLQQLLAVGARVRVVAPDVADAIQCSGVQIVRRRFVPADLDSMWLVVAAATPQANREVADAAEKQHVFVNAVDDPANASAFLSGVVRREGVTIAISTSGQAPALTALLREGLDALLPRDLAAWIWRARAERVAWRRDGVPMDERKPRLLQALNALYGSSDRLRHGVADVGQSLGVAPDLAQTYAGPADLAPGAAARADVAQGFSPAVPWLSGPEDSWL
jgi:siroheme synthase-like protein